MAQDMPVNPAAFPQLDPAPIKEAVLEIRVAPQADWDVPRIARLIQDEFPEYTGCEQFKRGKLSFIPEKSANLHSAEWQAVRFRSNDGKRIVVFDRELFAFSQLAPYQSWDIFLHQGLRLWHKYLEISSVDMIQRIGVRFINSFPVRSENMRLNDYFSAPVPPASCFEGTRLGGFLHQEQYLVTGRPYSVTIIRTAQQVPDKTGQEELILDVDVATTESVLYDDEQINVHLREMHSLKNLAFFCSLAPALLVQLKEAKT